MSVTDRQPITALVLAGSRTKSDPVANSDNKPLKSFVDINGTPMIDRVLKTLDEVTEIDNILVCLPSATATEENAPCLHELLTKGRAKCFDPEDGPSASVLRAVELTPDDHDLLITTADHPLLTPEMVQAFIKGAETNTAGINIGMAALSVIRKKYPEMKRTRLRFKDGGYSGCNLFYLRGLESRRAIDYWQNLETYRKQPWKMALAINPLLLIGYLLKLLTLEQVFSAIGRRCGTEIQPVILPYPEAAIDVDSPGDLAFVRDYLSKHPADGHSI